MPLYKLTEKRLAKRARADAEGLTDLEDLMGLESGSSSGSGSDEDSNATESEGSSNDESETGEDGKMDSEEESSSEDDDESSDRQEFAIVGEKRKRPVTNELTSPKSALFSITNETALESPLYPHAFPETERTYTACVLCPGKIMKTDIMVERHLASGSHHRARKRWVERMKLAHVKPLPSSDPREVIEEILELVEVRRNARLRTQTQAGRRKKPPIDHMKSAPIDPEVAAAQIRRQAKSPRVRVREEQKATKKAWLASSTDRDTLQVKAAPLEKDRLLKKRKRAEMKAAGSERAGKGRSLRNVRKEKRALKLLEAAGNSGMGADAGGLGLNRMAKRMMARGKVTGQ